jgi:uncharacterized membrane protein YidH (DUF202 family)
MNKGRNPIVLILAIIGVCAVVYGIWHHYQGKAAEDQAHSILSAPAPSGYPDLLHATPGAPPPQP